MECDEQHSVSAPSNFKIEILTPFSPATVRAHASDSQNHRYSGVLGVQRFVEVAHHTIEIRIVVETINKILLSTKIIQR
jgi:hypothetical protein